MAAGPFEAGTLSLVIGGQTQRANRRGKSAGPKGAALQLRLEAPPANGNPHPPHLCVLDGKGAVLLDCGPVPEPCPPPFQHPVKGSRRQQCLRALLWLVSNELAEVRVGGCGPWLGGAEEGQGEAGGQHLRLDLLVSFSPAIFAATEEDQEASACVNVLVVAWQEERWQQRREAPGGAALGPSAGAAAAGAAAEPMQVDGMEDGPGQGDAKGAVGAGQEGAGEGDSAEAELPPPSALRDALFALVLPSDWQREEPDPVGLRCRLYRYQRRCLSWMLWRESFGRLGAAASAEGDPDSIKTRLPAASQAWQRLPLSGGGAVYWNPLEGELSRQPKPPPFPQVPGGLLCDEMGLGKTVEIIALMLANPSPSRAAERDETGPASSPSGSQQAEPAAAAAAAAALEGSGGATPQADVNGSVLAGLAAASGGSAAEGRCDGGTLIICPNTLLEQWKAELENHAHGSLVVEEYNGLASMHPPPTDRKKPAQREMELYDRLLSGGTLAPTFDPEQDARQAAERLRRADCVLTTFDVLQREIHYQPNKLAAGALRQPKRYAIPTCPLLQVRWFRLCVDEAQLVGPQSNAGSMVEKITAVHRWCMTGTPLTQGASHGLADVRGLLHVLQHQPFANPDAWGMLVGRPYKEGDPACWELLRGLLRPLMWRNTKAEVAEECHLPPRMLKVSYLAFQSGEKEVYDQVLEGVRASWDRVAAEEEQQAAAAAAAAAAGSPEPSSRRGLLSGRKRGHSSRQERQQEDVTRQLGQLRLAAIHPQLTRQWQQLSSDLQVNVGGTLSMEEIMGRLVDKTQYDLQETERQLCAHLNTLAMVLMGSPSVGRGRAAGKKAGAKARAGAEQGLDVEGSGSPRGGGGKAQLEDDFSPGPSAKKRRKSAAALSTEEAQLQALRLLEQSYRVGEKGIDALDTPLDQIHIMEDIQAASGTVVAWHRLQVNTGHQLATLYRSLGRPEDAQRMELDVQKKRGGMKEQAELGLAMAQAKLEKLQQQADELRAAVLSSWGQAGRLGFPASSWGETRDAAAWLSQLGGTYREAQRQEEVERETQTGKTQYILGEHVHKALGELEKAIQGELTLLSSYVDGVHLEEGVGALRDATRNLAGASQERLDRVAALMQQQLKLLPGFRRKTLQANFFWILPPDQPAAQQAQQEEQTQQAEQGGEAGPSAAQPGPAGGSTDGVGPIGDAPAPAAAAAEEETELAAERAAVRAAAAGGQRFVGVGRFCGALPGFVFKLGDEGVGYYADCPPEAAPLLTAESVMHCATAVLRALVDHGKKLEKLRAGPEAAALDRCELGAIQAKLDSVQHQLHLLRLLKECHVAECQVILKSSVQADLDADLAAAAEEAPVSLTSPDALQRRIEQLKGEAQGVRAKKRFMLHRLQETRERVQQAAGGRAGGAGDGEGSTGAGATTAPAAGLSGETGSDGHEAGAAVAEAADAPGPSTSAAAAAAEAAAHGGPAGAHPQALPELECPVCLRPIEEDIQVFSTCGHSFCKDCAPKLVLERGECAVCRTKVTKKQVYRVAAAGGAATADECDPDAGEAAQERVAGSWSIKVHALVRRTLHIAHTRPEEKVLVFSQFPAALKLLGWALDVNNIKHVRLDGDKKAVRHAFHSFSVDPEVRCFLIPHNKGAVGLTLVRANHVFLLEPATEPSMEQQAIARVHRLGQMKDVYIHRLLVRGSVEEEVVRIQESKHALLDKGGDNTVTTVEDTVRKEGLQWGEVQQLVNALL